MGRNVFEEASVILDQNLGEEPGPRINPGAGTGDGPGCGLAAHGVKDGCRA